MMPGWRPWRARRPASWRVGCASSRGRRIGLAWGTTLASLVAQLEPLNCQAQVVQLNGAANPAASGLPYAGGILAGAARAWRGGVLQFPVPAFFDYPETKAAMWRERSIRAVIEAQDALDVAVFGVGALGRGSRSHVYSGGYLDADDVAGLRAEGVVGDVCTVMLRADGTHEGLALNDRASGMAPDRLRRIPRRLCVASGVGKARGLVAALRAGVVSVLVAEADLVAAVAHRVEQ